MSCQEEVRIICYCSVGYWVCIDQEHSIQYDNVWYPVIDYYNVAIFGTFCSEMFLN